MTATTTSQHPTSAALSRALGVTSSQTWDADARMPLVPTRGAGAHFWDVDGQRFVDLTSCTGSAPLGMSYRPVVDVLIEELNRSGGVLPGTINELRTKTAELLRTVFPCAERALFFRTGSCATSGAARIARVHTGRRLILTAGFHGWHDWQLQYKGTADVAGRDADCIDFGYDLHRLRALLEENTWRVAAVFVTPEVTCMPMEDLREMNRLAAEHSALFMLDEIITASRFVGGLHGFLGLQPDVITVSKGLCNGSALSAVLGRGDVMLAQEKTYLGNTFMREITPFAGALVTLPALHQEGGIDEMTTRAAALAAQFNDESLDAGVSAQALQNGALFHVLFEHDHVGERFYETLRAAGVHAEYGGTHLPTSALTDADMEQVKQSVSEAMKVTAAATTGIAGGTPGGVSQDAFARFALSAFRAGPAVAERWWQAHSDLGTTDRGIAQ